MLPQSLTSVYLFGVTMMRERVSRRWPHPSRRWSIFFCLPTFPRCQTTPCSAQNTAFYIFENLCCICAQPSVQRLLLQLFPSSVFCSLSASSSWYLILIDGGGSLARDFLDTDLSFVNFCGGFGTEAWVNCAQLVAIKMTMAVALATWGWEGWRAFPLYLCQAGGDPWGRQSRGGRILHIERANTRLSLQSP